MSKEQILFGLTKEQVKTFNDYFLEVKAREAIPYLHILGSLQAFSITALEKTSDPAQLPLPLVVDKEPGGEDVPEDVVSPV